MSSDNYYIIRKHPIRGFAIVMGFASDDDTPQARRSDRIFDSVDQAISEIEADDQYPMDSEYYSEYGWHVHPECGDSWMGHNLDLPDVGTAPKERSWERIRRYWRSFAPQFRRWNEALLIRKERKK
jgi:hypothetical protein